MITGRREKVIERCRGIGDDAESALVERPVDVAIAVRRAALHGHEDRARKLQQSMASAANGSDGRLHPNKVLSALQQAIGNDSVVITDGGDFLSFARVGLNAPTMLDPGPFGCIGVGVPYGIAASLAFPDKPVVVATGDGAFGFNAIEVDTAVRHKAPVLIVVANNGAWQIEVHDQTVTHGKVVGTKLQFADYAGMARSFGMHAERGDRGAARAPNRKGARQPSRAARHGRHAGRNIL